jgi:hypothetical protein
MIYMIEGLIQIQSASKPALKWQSRKFQAFLKANAIHARGPLFDYEKRQLRMSWEIAGIDHMRSAYVYLMCHKLKEIELKTQGFTADPQGEGLIAEQDRVMKLFRLKKAAPLFAPKKGSGQSPCKGVKKPKAPKPVCECGTEFVKLPMERHAVCLNCGCVFEEI